MRRSPFRSIYWKRHRKVVFAMVAGLLVLTVGFGGARVSAITSSERHEAEAVVNYDIKGLVPLFDDNVVHTISVQFNLDDYARLIEAYQKENEKEFIEASITIDNTTISSVGLRLKGNSTLRGLGGAGQRGGQAGGGGAPGANGAGNAGNQVIVNNGGGMGSTVSASNPDSLPWLISFDEFVKGQRYQGYKDIAIRPVLTSQTMLNEALALNLIAGAGEPSQQTSYSAFSLNGGAAALRLVLEVPSENYAADNFAHDGVLYKALSTGKFAYVGDDPLAYDTAFKQITRKKQQDLKPLITLLQWVNTASDAEFAANLDKYVEVDSLARYIALQTLLNNFDDMAGPGQNYYLWYDLETGKFSVLSWDLNLAFGQGMGGRMIGGGVNGGQIPGAGQAPGGNQPGGVVVGGGMAGGRGGNRLKERFLANTAFQARYQQAYTSLRQQLYGSGAANAELDRLATVIKASNLIDAAKLESEVTALRTAIGTQAARAIP